jgi:hypothetical protein
MAIFKSQVLTQASGSVGGLTYTRTASGMTLRARSMPVNPSTARQQVVRDAVASLSTRWSTTLTENRREQWSLYAKNVGVKNALGDTIHLSGISMFVRCNTPRVQAGLTPVDDGPAIFQLGDPPTELEITQAATTPFAVTASWVHSGVPGTLLMYVSQAKSPSINFFKGPYQFNGSDDAGEGGLELVPNPTWVQGQKIFARARISYADGRLSSSAYTTFILTQTPAV